MRDWHINKSDQASESNSISLPPYPSKSVEIKKAVLSRAGIDKPSMSPYLGSKTLIRGLHMKNFLLVCALVVSPLMHAADLTAVFVVGLPRSGTSCITGVIHEMGISVGRLESLKPSDKNNERGFFENMPLMYLNEEILNSYGMTAHNPLEIQFAETPQFADDVAKIAATIKKEFDTTNHILFKDVRTAVMLPFYIEAAKQLGFTPKFVVIRRDLLDAIESGRKFEFTSEDIAKMGEAQVAAIRESTDKVMARMKVAYEREINLHLRGKYPLVEVNYGDLCDSPSDVIEALKEFLPEIEVSELQIRRAMDFVDPTLKHH